MQGLEDRRMLSFGPVGAEFRVNTITANTQRFSSAGMDADGDFVVVWQSEGQDGDGAGIFAQMYSAAGAPLGGELHVNTTTADDQAHPSVAMDPNGDFVVAWQSYAQDGFAYGVFARRFNALGVPQGAEFQVNTFTDDWQHEPAVAMDDAGNFVVVWQSYFQDGDGYGVYAQRYNAAGATQGGEFRVNVVTADWQRKPSVAMDSLGNFAVAWESNLQDGSGYGIFARRYNSAGVPQSGEFPVNTITNDFQIEPSIAMDDTGDFVVAWENIDTNAGLYEIRGQRYDAAGAPQGGEFLANTLTPGYQTSASVAMDSDGDFVIAWDSLGQDGSVYGVYAQKFSAAGVKQGGELQANTFTAGQQRFPSVAIDQDGDAVIAWQSDVQDGSAYGIYAKRFIETVKVLDDGEPGFSTAGNWVFFTDTGVGYKDDVRYAYGEPGSSDVAEWSLSVAAPGKYRVSATWFVNPDYFYLNSETATFFVSDDGVARGAHVYNPQVPPEDLNADGATWDDLGIFDITSNTVLVQLTTAGANGYVVADAIRIERVGDLAPTAEIQVSEGGFDIPDNTGSVDFGVVEFNDSPEKAFTISNVGAVVLNLGLPVLPVGFLLVSPPTQSLAPGENTTFVVRLDGTQPGSYAGEVSFTTEDSDENPFNFTISGEVLATQIRDNGEPAYVDASDWETSEIGLGRDGDYRYLVDTTGDDSATWTFDVTPGRYSIAATWYVNPSYNYLFAGSATFSVSDSGIARGTSVVSQQNAPGDFNDAGSDWANLGVFDITSTSLAVQLLSAGANGILVADGIRIQRIGDLVNAPEIQVTEGTQNIPDGTGSVAFGTIEFNGLAEKTFTISNVGTQPLTLTSPIVLPVGFILVSPPSQSVLGPGESTFFVVALAATQPGTYSGPVSFGTDDADENPFNFTLSGQVQATQIRDDGGPGYSDDSDWQSPGNGLGHDGDYRYLLDTTGDDLATWTFNVIPGQYRISATWYVNPSYDYLFASSATFTVYDGGISGGQAVINQQDAPNDFNADGSDWEDLGVFNISNAALVVELMSAGANGILVADAIRIIRVGDLPAFSGNAQADGGAGQSTSGNSPQLGSQPASPLRQDPPSADAVETALASVFPQEDVDDVAIVLAEDRAAAEFSDDGADLPAADPSNDSEAIDLALAEWV
ncbi:MAG: choice-of-anchor D domain-containing protein [Planctomycetes bacterium]|nr:choice-of-anchor D domain-containing protein [Planctomycetota bacterium]